jgi:hypothetical protein
MIDEARASQQRPIGLFESSPGVFATEPVIPATAVQ